MKALYFSFFISIAILLTACSSQPRSVNTQGPPPEISREASPEELISQALQSDRAEQQSKLYFQAAKSYWASNLYAQSDAALGPVNPYDLVISELPQYLSMVLSLATQNGNIDRIKKVLPLIPEQGLDKASITQQLDFALLLSKSYETIEQPIEAAITLIEHRGLIDEDSLAYVDEDIWRLLRSSQTSELSQYQYTGESSDAIAWLDLARAIQLNQISLDAQYQALQMWHQLWPEHPATLRPPHELTILQRLPDTRPDTITLALPFSGPISAAGKAIRDGFMSKYYAEQTSNPQQTPPAIRFFDTATENILDIYQQSGDNSLVIGPLDKQSLKALSNLDLLDTPTLALNYLEDINKKQDQLYQLGLAPETEAQQLALHLNKKGLKKVGIILPENNLGFRVYDAFIESYSELNGIVIESVFYKDQSSLASSVARLLGTGDSQSRKQNIQKITQTRLEFLPRRRQDIDALVMIAKPEVARQLKPLFAYHYAADLPVFASSHIHNEVSNSHNRDLEGIEFIEMPWMLSNTIEIKGDIRKAIPESNEQYNRFYALGADSYSLAPRLQLLKEVRGSQMQGHTGTLSMNEDGVIHRELEWARFKKGKAIIIKE